LLNQEKSWNNDFVHEFMMLGWGRATQDQSPSLSLERRQTFCLKYKSWSINALIVSTNGKTGK